MKKKFFKFQIWFLTLTIIIFGTLALTSSVGATDLNALQQQQSKKQQELNEASRAADAKMREAQDLKDEIAVFEASIAQVEAAIALTEFNINQTQAQIDETQKQIDQKQKELDIEKENLYETMRVMYESPSESALEVIIGSNSLSEIMNRSQYVDALESKIEVSINTINQIKAELETKRNELEKKKTELGDLKSQQTAQKKGLDAQKAEKDRLYSNARAEQMSLEAAVEADRQALQQLNAMISALQRGQGRANGPRVKKGDVIGFMGGLACYSRDCPQGYSTGPHLHFATYQGEQSQNPRNYLGSIFSWPLDNPRVTQEYGYSSLGIYLNNFHGAMDMTTNNNPKYGAPIHAAADGIIVWHGWKEWYGTCIWIDHGNGLMSFYAHMID